jgi:hypothetical protein
MTYTDFVNQFIAMNPTYKQIADAAGISLEILVPIIITILIWSLIWKGFALWKAAGKKQMIWFIVLFLVNTIGILDILYIYVFSKIDLEQNAKKGMMFENKKQKRSKK